MRYLAAVVFSLMLAGMAVVVPTPARAADVVVGEILDLACYIPKGAKGPSHARCAKTCAEHGMPLGLLDDEGKVYLLYPKHGKEKAFDAVKVLAAERARITGKISVRAGISGIEVHEAVAAE